MPTPITFDTKVVRCVKGVGLELSEETLYTLYDFSHDYLVCVRNNLRDFKDYPVSYFEHVE